MRRGGSPYNALSEGCSLGRADPPQEDEAWGDDTEMGTLAVTEELHAKQQEAARKEAERAARKGPQDAAAGMRRAPGNQRPKGFGRARRCSWQDAAVSTDQGHRRANRQAGCPCQVSPFAFGLPPGFSDPRRPDQLVTRSWYSCVDPPCGFE